MLYQYNSFELELVNNSNLQAERHELKFMQSYRYVKRVVEIMHDLQNRAKRFYTHY